MLLWQGLDDPNKGFLKSTCSMWHMFQRCQLVQFTCKPYGFLRFARAYDAILTDIYDFCRFKLTIIPRFIFELLTVCND